MSRSASVDGFELTYDRLGSAPPVVLLHGWPESRRDYAEVGARLPAEADLIVPDLRGFDDSDRHPRPPADAFSRAAQADAPTTRCSAQTTTAPRTPRPAVRRTIADVSAGGA